MVWRGVAWQGKARNPMARRVSPGALYTQERIGVQETAEKAPAKLARTHTARLPLRLSPELLAQAKGHAEGRGESLSDFCRRALAGQIARDELTAKLERDRAAIAATGPFFLDATEEAMEG